MKAPDALKAAVITVGGSGFAPFASGSWGSLAASFLHLLLALVIVRAFPENFPRALNLATLLGIATASHFAVHWGAWAIAKFGSDDPKPFVLDEFAGQWVALLVAPAVALSWPNGWPSVAALAWLASQFFLFRVFDVLKPPPARQLEDLPAGWGVLCDDLMAGVYANLAGQAIWRFTPLPSWFS